MGGCLCPTSAATTNGSRTLTGRSQSGSSATGRGMSSTSAGTVRTESARQGRQTSRLCSGRVHGRREDATRTTTSACTATPSAPSCAALGVKERRSRLPVHGPHPGAVHRSDGDSEDRGDRPAPVLGLRGRIRCLCAWKTPARPPSSRSESTSPRCARSLTSCRNLKHIIVVDHDGSRELKEREVAFSMDAQRTEELSIHPTTAESPSLLHYTSGTTGQPKGVQHVHYSLISQYLTAKMGAGYHGRRHLLVHGGSGLGHRAHPTASSRHGPWE